MFIGPIDKPMMVNFINDISLCLIWIIIFINFFYKSIIVNFINDISLYLISIIIFINFFYKMINLVGLCMFYL